MTEEEKEKFEESKDEELLQKVAYVRKEEYNDLNKYSKLYYGYTKLKKDPREKNSKTNEKLLHLLGQELIDVFEKVEQEMGANFDPKKFEEIISKSYKEATSYSVMSQL
mmetsp:Transcript_11833/g.10235  ORF Transcript_11833/g.10235 Transcript_11833/m.10235 type:complete len:109 (+) Transcript_11833:22-348(+)